MDLKITLGEDKPGDRKCGTCTLCCRLVPVAAINKPADTRCQHQRRTGCAIYARRPHSCATWSCRWLVDPDAHASGLRRPDRAHYVLDIMPEVIGMDPNDGTGPIEVPVIQVWVDPAYPEAWRDPALLEYLEQQASKDGIAALVYLPGNVGRAIFAPSLNAERAWFFAEPTPCNPQFNNLAKRMLAAGLRAV